MKRNETEKLLNSLLERLEYYRNENVITAYAPLKFDLKKRIDDLEEQIENLRNLLMQSPAEEIDFPNLERLKKLAFMDVENQDKEEFMEVSYSFLQDCKNVVKDSVINAQGDVHIGDNNSSTVTNNRNNTVIGNQGNVHIGDSSTTFTESKQSKNIRIFTYILVPFLVLTLAAVGWNYLEMQKPINLTVRLKNQTENVNLPFEQGQVTLTYGDKTETQTTKGEELNFKGIPANFRGEEIKLSFASDGFEQIKDKTFILDKEVIELPIQRDESLATIFGVVMDSNQQGVANATVNIHDTTTETDINGKFEVKLPFEKQLKQQRIRVTKQGYEVWDYKNPILDTEIQIVLEKLK
jgi:hypothetical protein